MALKNKAYLSRRFEYSPLNDGGEGLNKGSHQPGPAVSVPGTREEHLKGVHQFIYNSGQKVTKKPVQSFSCHAPLKFLHFQRLMGFVAPSKLHSVINQGFRSV